MLAGNNRLTQEQFISQISHPRKEEMASMIFLGASYEQLEDAGFAKVSVQEMVGKIKANVEGMEGFKVGETETADQGPSESGPSESGPSESGPSESGEVNTQA